MEPRKYEVDRSALLLDFLLLSDGIFDAEIVQEGQTLRLEFKNGQTFRLSLQELQAEE